LPTVLRIERGRAHGRGPLGEGLLSAASLGLALAIAVAFHTLEVGHDVFARR
jgi:hypothetical protein